MPEPSEIGLIKDKVKDPLQVLEDYKKKQGVREKGPDLTMALRDAFSGINPVINRTVGGSDYKDEVSELIKANLVIDKSKIKFGK